MDCAPGSKLFGQESELKTYKMLWLIFSQPVSQPHCFLQWPTYSIRHAAEAGCVGNIVRMV
jgi:hypothetical protein